MKDQIEFSISFFLIFSFLIIFEFGDSKQTKLIVDEGWYEFQFGDTNSTVMESFHFTTPNSVKLKVTDNYCNGDSFEIYNFGHLVGRTSFVTSNGCKSNTTDPSVAYDDPSWSHAYWDLADGEHLIQIKVVQSPYHGGAANLRVDSILEKCSLRILAETGREDIGNGNHEKGGIGRGGRGGNRNAVALQILATRVPFHRAKEACRAFNMTLADVNWYNFNEATDLAFRCSGAFSQTWIGSFSGDDYNGTCLTLNIGAMAPGGSVNVPICCNERLKVLCEEFR